MIQAISCNHEQRASIILCAVYAKSLSYPLLFQNSRNGLAIHFKCLSGFNCIVKKQHLGTYSLFSQLYTPYNAVGKRMHHLKYVLLDHFQTLRFEGYLADKNAPHYFLSLNESLGFNLVHSFVGDHPDLW